MYERKKINENLNNLNNKSLKYNKLKWKGI